MLRIVVPPIELFDESKKTFMNTKEVELRLEHSLVSLSKWESKRCKPFLLKTNKTTAETLNYIRCMTISQNIDPTVYKCIPQNQLDEIAEYISAPMTAT